MAGGGRGRPETARRLTEAAIACFSRKWYGTVSVAEICREAGLSNGVFYRYFDGKEALFKEILGQVLSGIREVVESVGGATPRDRVEALARALFRFTGSRGDLISVFREGQYRYFDYERRLVDIYMRGLSRALGREIGPAEYLFVFGGLRFCAIRWAAKASPLEPRAVEAILVRGLFPGLAFDPEKVFGGAATPLPVALEEGVRERLLRSGRRLFGEKGFFETNIHEVTGGAGLSVGAFYTHFESKEAFYAELIALVGRDIRGFISRNLNLRGRGASLNALELELRGLWLWLVYLSIDKNCYNIVREAEFILPGSVRDYYGAFIDGYLRRPAGLRLSDASPGMDETTAIEFLLGLAHYLGMEAAFDQSPLNARALIESLGTYLVRGMSGFLAPDGR
jgi:AcrR family transcriptional regulator